MAAGMVPWTGPGPRRARHLVPVGLPRRGEVVAAATVAVLLAHVLLAQLTLALALAFTVIGKASRWRLWWLLLPAAAGLGWTLALGPGTALAGFAAGPSSILWHLSGGHLAGRTWHPFAGFAAVQSWMPRQLPVALLAGAAEAALFGWLDWLHTDEWAVPPPRPGLIAAARRLLAVRAVSGGAVVTRDGCALGVVPSTGGTAELRWAELAHGTLIAGAEARDVTLTGLQVVHAALRRRKPVIVLDHGEAAVAGAVASACQATGTPLLRIGPLHASPPLAGTGPRDTGDAEAVGAGTAGASRLWGRGPARRPELAEPADRAARSGDLVPLLAAGPPQPADQPTQPASELGRVVRDRLAALVLADAEELAGAACAALAALAQDMRRIGVDGDALVWVPQGERVPAQAIAALLSSARDAGVSVLIGTTSAAAAAELCGLAGTSLIHRVTDRDLAARLAARAGTWLLPASAAARLAGQRPAGDPGPPAPASPAAPPAPGAPELVPGPVIPARGLLALGPAEFVLAVNEPRRRLIALGQRVPAPLPGSPAARS